jgi:hypothetical protein
MYNFSSTTKPYSQMQNYEDTILEKVKTISYRIWKAPLLLQNQKKYKLNSKSFVNWPPTFHKNSSAPAITTAYLGANRLLSAISELAIT